MYKKVVTVLNAISRLTSKLSLLLFGDSASKETPQESKGSPMIGKAWISLPPDGKEAFLINEEAVARTITRYEAQQGLYLIIDPLIIDWKGFYTHDGKIIPCHIGTRKEFFEARPHLFDKLIQLLKQKYNYKSPEVFIQEEMYKFISNPSLIRLQKSSKEIRETYPSVSDALGVCFKEIDEMCRTGELVPADNYKSTILLLRKFKLYQSELDLCLVLKELCDIQYNSLKHMKLETLYYKNDTRYYSLYRRVPRIEELIEKQKTDAIKKAGKAPKKQPLNTPGKDKPLAGTSAKQNVTLAKQCEEFGIPLSTLQIAWDKNNKVFLPSNEKKVEFAVVTHYRNQGFTVVPYEGAPLMMLMQAACLPYLQQLDKMRRGVIPDGENLPARTFSVQIDMYGADKKKLAEYIKSATESSLQAPLQHILNNQSIREWFPKLRLSDVLALYKNIPHNIFLYVVDKFLQSPAEHGSGWPDLALIKDGELSFVEVKVDDWLRVTQIDNYNNFMKPLSLNMSVVRVEKI